jgi:hypothetical protein
MPRTTTPKPTIAWQTFRILCKEQDIATAAAQQQHNGQHKTRPEKTKYAMLQRGASVFAMSSHFREIFLFMFTQLVMQTMTNS